jgi:hypothetical protein
MPSATVSGGSFTGTITVAASRTTCSPASQSNTSYFQKPSTSLETNGILYAGTYHVCLTATDAAFTNSPASFLVAVTGTGTACSQAVAFLGRSDVTALSLDEVHTNGYVNLICNMVTHGLINASATMISTGGTHAYCGLPTGGAAEFDFLHIEATQTAAAALIDICNHYPLTAHGSPTFTADSGYLGVDASATVYLDPVYAANTAGGWYLKDDAHLAAWSFTNALSGVSGGVVIGGAANTGAGSSGITPRYNDGTAQCQINSLGAASVNITQADSLGFYLCTRVAASGAGAVVSYRAAASIGSGTGSSNTVMGAAAVLVIHEASGVDSGGAYVIGLDSAGASFTSTDEGHYYNDVCSYWMTPVHGSC